MYEYITHSTAGLARPVLTEANLGDPEEFRVRLSLEQSRAAGAAWMGVEEFSCSASSWLLMISRSTNFHTKIMKIDEFPY